MSRSVLKSLARNILKLCLLLGFILTAPNLAKALDNAAGTNLLNPDWRPGLVDAGQPPGNTDDSNYRVDSSQPAGNVVNDASGKAQQAAGNKYFDPNAAGSLQNEAQQMKTQFQGSQPSGTGNATNSSLDFNNLMKDAQGNPISVTPAGNSNLPDSSSNGNSSGESGIHIQMLDASVDIPASSQANDNKKAKFSMIATLTCMYLFFPLASFIRNIMMGFLNFLGVPEEKISSKVGETLSSLSNVTGAGLRGASNFKSGTSGGPQAPKVNPVGGGVVAAGGMPGASDSAGPIKGPASGGGISAGPVSGENSATGSSQIPGAGAQDAREKSDISPDIASGAKVPGIEEPGKLAEKSPEENPLPPVATQEIDGTGQKPWDVPDPSKLTQDMTAVDDKSHKIYNGISQLTSMADGFMPGAGKLAATVMANAATVPLAVKEIGSGIKQFRQEGGMSFGDAVKAYTKTNDAFVGTAKIAGGVAGSAFGVGPQAPVVTGMAGRGMVGTYRYGRKIGKRLGLWDA
ncbi:hypothetical protein SDD30_14100 [Moorella naiadis]|uniref:hypothetical protein n=1 Tax=Moorella naiadis (nom. illeg.) TaxID=3093670 RepID=UPI003D9C9A08